MILGISFDTVAANKAFADKFSFPYKLLCDTTKSIGLAYGAADDASAQAPKRISYLVAPDGTIKAAWAKGTVNTKTHADDVLALI